MSIFSGKPNKPAQLMGHSVTINEGAQPVAKRLLRAKMRVEGLSRKLEKMQIRGADANSIAQTEFAISEWQKRLDVAEFENNLGRPTA